MKIEFETTEMTVKEGASLVAMMIALHGVEIVAELESIVAKMDGGVRITGDAGPAPVIIDPETTFAPPPPPPVEETFAAPSVTDAPAAGVGETNVSDGASAPPAPVAPPATAEAPPPPPPAAPPAGVELDAKGLPWDGRIHAATKGKNADGSWRGKKGVGKEVIESVTAELKAALGAPAPTAPPAAPVPPADAPAAAAPPPPSAPVSDAPSAAPPPSEAPPAATPAPVPVAPPAGASPAAEFARVMRVVTEAQTAGRLTPENTAAAVAAVGLAALKDLLVRPDLIPDFETTLTALMTPAAA